MNEPNGVLIVNKPIGMTSHDVVGKIRRLFGTGRVGHTGTLDPMAAGVLVVLVGRAAKASEYLVCDKKEYCATLRLGLTTDTEDSTGTVLTRTANLPESETVQEVCRFFEGEILQIPPMYSALKKNGQKLCDLARKGVVVEREPRPITVYRLACTPTDQADEYRLDVACSSGTYIRTLCADIGQRLGCGGVMASLLRTKTGYFSLSESYSLADLEAMPEERRLSCLIPTERLFSELPVVCLPAFFERLCRNGCELYQQKLHTAFPSGTRVRLCSADGSFFALGEVAEYPRGSAIQMKKLFELS